MAKRVATPVKKSATPVKSGAASAKMPAKATTAKKNSVNARPKSPAKHASGYTATKSAAAKAVPAKAAPSASKHVQKSAPKAAAKPAATTKTVKQAPPQASDNSAKAAPPETATARKAPAKKAAAAPAPPAPVHAAVRGETKEGIKYTKDFDAKFLSSQLKLLIEARESLTGQAVRLEDEANSLIDDEMGDVQFDDESGEGDTMVVERERDLFLSARARQDIEEIDAAIARLRSGTYGYSIVSLRPIPRERLEAIPWATELTEEKVGGIGKR